MSDTTSARVLIVFNPNAGRGKRARLDRALETFRGAGVETEVRQTAAPGDGARIAASAEPGWSAILAAGGDGTVNEVLNGLLARSGETPPERPALGVLPLGSANVAARELGLSLDPGRAAVQLSAARRRRISLGLLEAAGAPPRHFIQMAGVGFDARVVARVTPGMKRRLGRAAFAWIMLREWLSPDQALFDVTVDGIDSRASSVIACNGHYYGGGFVLVPEARLTEPALHVCLYRRIGRGALVHDTVVSAFGSPARSRGIDILRGTHVSVSGPPAPVQVDGEVAGFLPARLSSVPDAIDALMPVEA